MSAKTQPAGLVCIEYDEGKKRPSLAIYTNIVKGKAPLGGLVSPIVGVHVQRHQRDHILTVL